MDEAINERFAAETGLTVDQVSLLRKEIMKIGRNPMVESVEIIAIENGIDEDKAKNLLEKHKEYMRKMDGLAEQFKVPVNNSRNSPQFSRQSPNPTAPPQPYHSYYSTTSMIYSDF